MLDEAGLEDVGIVLSNDLDERTIKSILDEWAPVNAWGVGTKLACAFDQPSLGGVYKLSAIKRKGDDLWSAKLKVSESAAKLTLPGYLDVRRFYNEDGTLAGDMIFDVFEPMDDALRIVDPVDPLRQKKLLGKEHVDLLQPLARHGMSVLTDEDKDTMKARERAIEDLGHLDESQLRLLNPHTYPVGLEYGLNQRRSELVDKMKNRS